MPTINVRITQRDLYKLKQLPESPEQIIRRWLGPERIDIYAIVRQSKPSCTGSEIRLLTEAERS